MPVPIRILLAEDSSEDAADVLQGLRRAGYEPTAILSADQSSSRERDLLRLVLDSHADLMFVKNAHGHFTMANRAVAEFYGTTVEHLIGKSESDLSPHARETLRSAAAEQAVISSGRPAVVAGEPVSDPRTGATRWFDIRRVPIEVPGVIGPHVLGLAAETTERRMAESALRTSEDQVRQAQKMEAIGQLAGGVAHEFNNLLTAILGYTALLIETTDQPEMAADLQEIRIAGERAGSLTRQLLTFSRKQQVQPALLDLNEVLSELEKTIRQVIGEAVALETIKAASLGQIRADPKQIEQILVNLAANARDAMPAGGRLRIETTSDIIPPDPRDPSAAPTPCVTLVVSDTGTGIPPEIADRIFEPFFTTKAPGKGTGLGLAMVYGIVSQTSGMITVESERTGGATFRIRFPAIDVPAAATLPEARPGQPYGGTETILLVEDEVGVRHLVQRVLASKGYRVFEARDVAHAAEIAHEHTGAIHLLLSDVVMPGLSGPELATKIVARRPEIRVLFMSGFANRLSVEFGAPDGVSILHKPFTPENLARTVRERLDAPDGPPS
jgi:PAS domain S-box-containing protein